MKKKTDLDKKLEAIDNEINTWFCSGCNQRKEASYREYKENLENGEYYCKECRKEKTMENKFVAPKEKSQKTEEVMSVDQVEVVNEEVVKLQQELEAVKKELEQAKQNYDNLLKHANELLKEKHADLVKVLDANKTINEVYLKMVQGK